MLRPILLALLLCQTSVAQNPDNCPSLPVTYTDNYLEYLNTVFPQFTTCQYQFSYTPNTAVELWTSVSALDDLVEFSSGVPGQISYRLEQFSGNVTNATFFWAPGGFNLIVFATSGPQVSFGIRVFPISKDSVVKFRQLPLESQMLQISDVSDSGTTYVFTATSNILMCFTSPYTPNRYADSSYVYSGQGPEAVFIAMLSQLTGILKPLNISTISIYTVGDPTGYVGALVFSPIDNIERFTSNKISCDWSSSGTVADAQHGPALGTLVNSGDSMDFPILTRLYFSDLTATMSVYGTLPSNNMSQHFITNYTFGDFKAGTYQYFPVTALSITVDKGFVQFDTESYRFKNITRWGVPIVGDQGMLLSTNYGTMQNTQTIQSYTFVTDTYDQRRKTFQLNSGSGMGASDSWIAYGTTNSTDTQPTDFSWSNVTAPPPNSSFLLTGLSFAIEWFGGKAPSKGQMLTYRVGIAPGESAEVCPGRSTIFVNGTWTFDYSFTPNSHCTYEISWKNNTAAYINVTVQKQTYDGDAVILENRFPGGKSIAMTNGVPQKASTFFPPGTVYLTVRTSATTMPRVTISIDVSKATLGASEVGFMSEEFKQPVILTTAMDSGSTYTYMTDTVADTWDANRIVLTVVSAHISVPYYDNVFVYVGADNDPVLLGTLNDFLVKETTIVNSSSIRLYSPGDAALLEDSMVIVNNFANTLPIDVNNSAYYWSFTEDNVRSKFFLDATASSASGTIVNYAINTQFPIITKIVLLDPTSILSVYAGMPCTHMEKYKITEYTNASAPTSLPQMFPGRAVTFQLNKGTANIYFSSMQYNDSTTWGTANIGKSGLLISDYYGFNYLYNGTSYTYTLSPGSSDNLLRQFSVGPPSLLNQTDSWINYAMTNTTNWDQATSKNFTGPVFSEFSVVSRSLKVDWSNDCSQENMSCYYKWFGQIIPYKVVAASFVVTSTTTAAPPSTTSPKPIPTATLPSTSSTTTTPVVVTSAIVSTTAEMTSTAPNSIVNVSSTTIPPTSTKRFGVTSRPCVLLTTFAAIYFLP